MPDPLSDLHLLRRYAEHDDADAFGLLVARHRRLVYGTCVRTLGHTNGSAAEDATQEAFLKLMKHAATIDTSPPAWLHRVAVNLCRDTQRSEAARRKRENRPDPRPIPLAADDAADARELERRLDAALESLPDAERALLAEHFLCEVPQSVIADREGVSRATLLRRVGRALVLLRERMGARATAAGVLASLLAAGAARADALPAAVTGSLAKLVMASGTTASGVEELPPAAVPTAGAAAGGGAPSPLAFTLVFLVPLFAMIVCAGLGAAVVLSRPAHSWESADRGAFVAETPTVRGFVVVDGSISLASDRIASAHVEGDGVQLVFGDGHAVATTRADADARVLHQTGRTLEALARDTP